mmetsp:Transcript_17642/g.51353  ORF Transcript_17642/g.51353 Transcript_17642/m.51353 type:complete len:321 (-) Transcript_17642:138-1100(-)|eukprot:CAMPEP_0113563708 /NCGR_PEP_ID=MMETSP0015_2-20120614/21214_1 /TAXON_ID=2838 /ORGANISM="Odontella" /LENGTH=320 /DNA_ID=CAMNT_0000465709 /DNA_START=348 /DNA_END=1310 /DNA_ORIENTATION=- /assembly_acc=CAM_ASM_000160
MTKEDFKVWLAKSEQLWTDQVDRYMDVGKKVFQGTATCLSMIDVEKHDRVLEAGCGPGTHSLLISKNFLKSGNSVLVSTDFSKGMLSKLKTIYDESDFTKVPGVANSYMVDGDTEHPEKEDTFVDIEALKPKESFNKFVYACRADNQRLPFADNYFGAYLANLTMQLVQRPDLQIKEAYRVLKPGSKACFTVYGRPENCLMSKYEMKALQTLKKEYPSVYDTEKRYKRCNDLEMWKKHFEDANFKLLMWHQPCNLLFKDGKDLMYNYVRPMLLCYGETKLADDKENLDRLALEYEQESGENQLKTFEILVMLGIKPEESE